MQNKRWQRTLNPKQDEDPHHHDVAILVTRRDICSSAGCSTLGEDLLKLLVLFLILFVLLIPSVLNYQNLLPFRRVLDVVIIYSNQ